MLKDKFPAGVTFANALKSGVILCRYWPSLSGARDHSRFLTPTRECYRRLPQINQRHQARQCVQDQHSEHRLSADGTFYGLRGVLGRWPLPTLTRSVFFFGQENIEHYLKACAAFGLRNSDLFDTTDLFEAKKMSIVRPTFSHRDSLSMTIADSIAIVLRAHTRLAGVEPHRGAGQYRQEAGHVARAGDRRQQARQEPLGRVPQHERNQRGRPGQRCVACVRVVRVLLSMVTDGSTGQRRKTSRSRPSSRSGSTGSTTSSPRGAGSPSRTSPPTSSPASFSIDYLRSARVCRMLLSLGRS